MAHPINKRHRHDEMLKKYKKRINLYGREFTALKSHGKPCSCWACKSEKYSRKDKVEERKEVNSALVYMQEIEPHVGHPDDYHCNFCNENGTCQFACYDIEDLE